MSGLSNLFVDVTALPANGFGFVQLLFLGACYAYVLMFGSNLIKDGSELLLLLPAWAGIVGPIILPVLGAVPDGAIVLFSGMGPDAQTQLSVGIGALAGSTIMLLTVPWALSMWAGRVNTDADGNGNYVRPRGAGKEWAKLNPPNRILGSGVNFTSAIDYGSKIMLLTALPFFVIQIPSIIANCSLTKKESDCETPRVAALVGGLMCVLLFVFYLWDQYRIARDNQVLHHKIEEVQRKNVGVLVSLNSLFGAAAGGQDGHGPASADRAPGAAVGVDERSRLVDGAAVDHDGAAQNAHQQLAAFLKPYFRKYDTDHSGSISKSELTALLREVGENRSGKEVQELMQRFDSNNTQDLDYEEFVSFVEFLIADRAGRQSAGGARELATEDSHSNTGGGGRRILDGDQTTENLETNDEGDDEEEEDEEMPEDIAALPVEQQHRAVLKRSFFLMIVGTLIVLLFSDPMVDVLSELGNRIHLSPFYVAFVLAPLVSNGSELIAAYAYAAKKTEASISISFSTLIGAACMNNTFCLSIFLFLVYGKQLQWVFVSETLVILVVELIMFFLVVKRRSMSTWKLFVVLGLLPFSLLIVAVLEQVAGLD